MATCSIAIFSSMSVFGGIFFSLNCIRFSSLYKLAGLFPKRIFKIQFTKMKSEDLRKLVLSKYKNGESSTKILEDLNWFVSSRTIRRWCQMVRETGSISSSHSPGRPRIIRTKGMTQKVKNRMKRKKRVPIRKLASELDISKSSVVRILKQDLPRSIKTPSATVVYSSVYDIKTDKFRQYFTVFRRLIGHSVTDREGIRTLLVKQSYTIVFDP